MRQEPVIENRRYLFALPPLTWTSQDESRQSGRIAMCFIPASGTQGNIERHVRTSNTNQLLSILVRVGLEVRVLSGSPTPFRLNKLNLLLTRPA